MNERANERGRGQWYRWLRCAALASVAALGCGPDVKAGLSVQVLVAGNDTPGERATRIDVVFDRAMVKDDVLGRELPLDRAAPFRLEPPVTGTLRWREDRKLSFEPAQPLPRATAFVVTIPKGTHAPDLIGLTDDFEHAFETERVLLSSEFVRDFSLPDPKQWATPDQRFRLTFNQPMLPARVLAGCRFTSVDGSSSVAPGISGDTAAARESFEISAAEPLAGGTAFRFACDPKLESAEGKLGFAPSEATAPDQAVEANGQRPNGALEFRTFGPFKVEEVTPAGDAVSPDERNVTVRFSTPPRLPEDPSSLSIEPAPEDWSSRPYVNGSELTMRVSGLQPHTNYTVVVPAGLVDAFGQRLLEPFKAGFRTGSVTPGYALDTGSWSVEPTRGGYVAWARNVTTVDVTAAAINETQLFELLPQLTWWDDEAVDLAALKITAVKHTLKPQGDANKWNQLLLDPRQLLGDAAKKTRFYYMASRSPEVMRDDQQTDASGKLLPQGYSEVLLNVTDLGVTSKLSGNSGLVWVTRLSDGAPQPGAEVSVRERSGALLWRGLTEADGAVTLPGRAALLAKLPAKPAPASGGDEEEYEEEGDYGAQLLIFVRHGDDMTFVDPDRVGTFASWGFGVENDTVPKEFALRGFLHTDRGLYRPGETVHMRGLARLLKLGGGLFVPPKAEAELSVSDPKGQEVLRQRLPVSRFGGFSFDHQLPEVLPLGDYRVRASLPHGEFNSTFTVEEFRAATFEVELSAKQRHLFAGDTLSLSGLARYFYGAPVRGADIKLTVHNTRRHAQFAGYEDFAFVDESDTYEPNPYGEEWFVTEQAAKLDAKGGAAYEVPLPEERFSGPGTLLVSATVQDETNQTVSANLALPVHRSRLYLGLDTGGWVAEEKAPQQVRLVALDHEGRGVSANAKLRVVKEDYSCAWERWGHLGSYRCERKEKVISASEVALAADKPLVQTLTYPEPGTYVLALEGVDARKQAVRAARSVWVWGDSEGSYRVDDSARFEIVADKREYRVGDTAKLVLQTPTSGARALVTVERDGVLSRRTIAALQPGQPILVPVTEAFAPNAFVSVMLTRGRTGEGARGLPKATMGLINLPVSHADKRLSVQVETDQREYRPGSPVAVSVRVKDASGKPVQAEVAVAAADEGVLSLINFKTPDPLATFFAPWGWAVKTASQYERLAQVPAPDQERYVTGGDSAGMPGSLRSRFRATAYWNAAIVTDANGEAKLEFAAPDNLTAFRVMAVAADAGDHFGSGDQRFVVNKPVQLISALPRFANVGDRFEAAVMVTNDTAQAGVAKLRFSVDGGVNAASGASHKDVSLAAGGRERVSFPVTAVAEGPARFRFWTELGDHRDGLELEVPVHYPAAIESRRLSEGATTQDVNVAVSFPEGTLPQTARLDIAVDPDGLAGIEEGLQALVHYPYGCLEQTTSALIPLVAVKELTRSLGLRDLDGERLERFIRAGIAKILRHQTASGGFGLWPRSEPNAYLTAYALWGLKLAGDAGYSLDAPAMQRGIDYLRQQLSSEPNVGQYQSLSGELSSRAFALYVLSVLGSPEPAAATLLAGRADLLPRFGQAFLAQALAASVGAAHPSVTGLLERWQPIPSGSGKGTLVKEIDDEHLYWYFSSHVRTSAAITDTLLALRPDDARLPGLIRGLLDQRRAEGSWYTTQDSLYALVALTRYAKARASQGASVHITRGADTLLNEALAGVGLGRLRHLELQVDPKDTRPLTISATEGTVHYRVRARYRLDTAHQPARENGLVVKRVFLDPETGAVLVHAVEGQMVRVQLTLTPHAQQSFVALSDYLPAGLEPLNTRFATVPHNLPPDDRDWYTRLWVSHRELGERRVDVFMDWLPQRPGNFEYLARATSVGTFVVPGTTAEKMYDPDVNGRTELRTFQVAPRKP